MKYITSQFSKYLVKLEEEISLYNNEDDIWKLTGDLKNTPGNLALHICGNLKHNIGAVMGSNGYVRNRDLEFSQAGVTKADILKEIRSASEMVIPILEAQSDESLRLDFPEKSHGEDQTYYDALIRLALHFAYHVGQINYHRRILTF
ncbi:MAG: DUF1572 family protein [Ignavibacteria bacterium]|nr:DUF1572 family protein [Ignavibacteria bacterium]